MRNGEVTQLINGLWREELINRNTWEFSCIHFNSFSLMCPNKEQQDQLIRIYYLSHVVSRCKVPKWVKRGMWKEPKCRWENGQEESKGLHNSPEEWVTPVTVSEIRVKQVSSTCSCRVSEHPECYDITEFLQRIKEGFRTLL